MSAYTAECLESAEAVRVAYELVEEMLIGEEAYYAGLGDSADILSRLQRDFREKHPETPLVRRNALKSYMTKAALLGAGVTDQEDAPAGLIERIRDNEDCLHEDTLDLFMGRPATLPDDVNAFTVGAHALGQETYVELFAYQYEVIGKMSLSEFEEGDN